MLRLDSIRGALCREGERGDRELYLENALGFM